MSKKKHKKHVDSGWIKSGKFNHHHDVAKSRGGTWSEKNIFLWDTNAHKAYHTLFGTMNLEESSQLLIELYDVYSFLFGERTLLEASVWLTYIHEMNEQGYKVDILSGTYGDNTLS